MKSFFGLIVWTTMMVLVIVPTPTHISASPPFSSHPQGRATYYRTPDGLGTPTGACGYAKTGVTYNNGNVAAASTKLWRNGAVCGACFQVKCTVKGVCNGQGVSIVVTDHGDGDNTDFVLSSNAFGSMALPDQASTLLTKGVVGIQYRRIRCHYRCRNLMVKVTEQSRNPDYLSIVMLYQGGQYDVLSVQIWDGNVQEWKRLRAVYGAVYDFANPPTAGPISLKLELKKSGSGAVKLFKLRSVVPCCWKPGVAYDSHIKIL